MNASQAGQVRIKTVLAAGLDFRSSDNGRAPFLSPFSA